MQEMIMHHAQAVEMTALIESHTENKNLRLLGARISQSQSDEMKFMKRTLATLLFLLPILMGAACDQNTPSPTDGNGNAIFLAAASVSTSFNVLPPPPCEYALTPTGASISAGGGRGVLRVVTGPGCAWTATSDSPAFLTLASAASGTDPRWH